MAEQPKLLVPREEDDRLALELQGTGIPLVCAPVTQRIPTPSEEWSDPIRRLQDGEYEWVVVSSVATARFLDDHYVLDELFANTRVAAIGAASANAMRELGVKVELVGPEPASAATLVSVFPEGSGAVFLPCAAGSAPTLGQGLSEKGWTVEKLRLYESVEIEELPVSWEGGASLVDEDGSGAVAGAAGFGSSVGAGMSRVGVVPGGGLRHGGCRGDFRGLCRCAGTAGKEAGLRARKWLGGEPGGKGEKRC